MADGVKMVTVNGVRYREEDAPKETETKATEPQNKARKPANKSASSSDDKE